jgi:hypothetical protein
MLALFGFSGYPTCAERANGIKKTKPVMRTLPVFFGLNPKTIDCDMKTVLKIVN